MAAPATRATLSFHLPPPKSRTQFTKVSFLSIHKLQTAHLFTLHSIDVSKEDRTPSLSDSSQTNPPAESPVADEAPKFDKRRFEEKFAVLNTGIYECRSCGYKYDESVGDPTYPIPSGFQFDKLPDDWRCPTCGAARSFFESKSVEIAGFAQNQQYGLGGNALTSGQKAILIYGTLFFLFVLFLSGYFLLIENVNAETSSRMLFQSQPWIERASIENHLCLFNQRVSKEHHTKEGSSKLFPSHKSSPRSISVIEHITVMQSFMIS